MNHGPYIQHLFGQDAEASYANGLGWLTAACFTSIPWPTIDVRITYDGDDYFIRGVRDHGNFKSDPAITMRCTDGTANEAIAKIYRFASILGWFKRGYVDVGGYITGTHPNLYSESPSTGLTLAMEPHGFNCNYLPLIRDDKTRRALAYWREGCRLRNLHTGYAFLSFFKVIESQFEKSSDRIAWINANIPKLSGEAGKRVQVISTESGDVGTQIYASGRCAIAHAQFSDGRGDPDLPDDRRRLARDLIVIEALARRYISDTLQVPDEMTVYRSRDRLEPLTKFVPLSSLNSLRKKEHVLRPRVGLNGLLVSVTRWPGNPVPELCNLTLRTTDVRDGCVNVSATNASGSICLKFVLDFPAGKAHIDLTGCSYLRPHAGQTPDDAIAVARFRKDVIGNGRIELWLPDGSRMDFEVVIPLNVDIGATWRLIDLEIADLERLRPIN